MNTNLKKANKTFVTKVTKIVARRLDKERKKAAVPYEENYKKLVNEAVLVIKDQWETHAKYCADVINVVGSVTLEAYNSFYVTKNELELSSYFVYRVINPETGSFCFDTKFKFKSEEHEKQFLADVKALLPENTSCEAKTVSKRTQYSFYLKLDV